MTDQRPEADLVYTQMAHVISQRGTCKRRQVGCVLTAEDNAVLAVGYNGVPRDHPHCRAGEVSFCRSADAESGDDLYLGCLAIHAEANALDQCRDRYRIHTCYSTVSPCVQCALELLNTPCRRLVFSATYDAHWSVVRMLWEHHGREWRVQQP